MSQILDFSSQGIGDFGEAINNPQKDIQDIKDSIKNLENNLEKKYSEKLPSYYSIARNKSIVHYDVSLGRQKVSEKGWICDIPFSEIEPSSIHENIKQRFGAGSYDILICDEVGKTISFRSIIIPKKSQESDLIKIGFWKPASFHPSSPLRMPVLMTRHHKAVLDFSCDSREEVVFHGVLEEDIEGFFEISINWSLPKNYYGHAQWFLTFNAKDSNNKDFSFFKDINNKQMTPSSNFMDQQFCSKSTIDVSEKFTKGTSFSVILQRYPESKEDTIKNSIFFKSLSIFAKKTKKIQSDIKNSKNTKMMMDIISSVKDEENKHIEDNIEILEAIIEYFNNSTQLKIKGGFIDLSLISQDFEISEDFVVSIAESYIKYNRSSLYGKISLKRVSVNGIGQIPILKRKRWSWI